MTDFVECWKCGRALARLSAITSDDDLLCHGCWEVETGAAAAVPYPKFCRHPDKCAGLGCCPEDPTCAD